MTESELYDLAGYGRMIADHGRVDAYREALREVVRPGCTVLDAGAGTGLMTLLALGLGAARVYAVEPSDVLELGRRIARDNRIEGRVSFIRDSVFNVALEDRVDVVVSDLRGVLPLFRRLIPATIDARERLLKPEGRLIPARDHLFAAVVEAPDVHGETLGPWYQEPGGFDMTAGVELAANTWRKAQLAARQLLTEPVRWATLDYATIADSGAAGELAATVSRTGRGHGLALWFDADLTDHVKLSSAPGDDPRIYGQAFFPWPRAVELAPGDVVEVSLRANLVGDRYVWRWETSFSGRGEVPDRFRQSTFYGSLLSPDKLHHTRADFVPSPSRKGDIDGRILSLFDGRRSLREIADTIVDHHPDAFDDPGDAFDQVARLAWRYRA